MRCSWLIAPTVALRKESVDRNFDAVQIVIVIVVALRKESVDRNSFGLSCADTVSRSLSARRAWIEIIDYIIDYATDASRSPQGERG